jgi:predicted CoA-binding protein
VTLSFSNPDDHAIAEMLKRAKRIAVVGLSPKANRPSNRIARYLLDHGYEVVPVYPTESTILGQKVYRRLGEVPGPVDLVNVFRRSEELHEITQESIEARAPAIWFQVGCVDERAAEDAGRAGIVVVMDRCIMVDHAQLLGR